MAEIKKGLMDKMDTQFYMKGTASELLLRLPQLEIAPNIITRKLNISVGSLLREYGIRYESFRGHEGRMITLTLQPKPEE